MIECLRNITPDFVHSLIRVTCGEYVPASECRILSLMPFIAVPQPCASVFRLDFITSESDMSVKWLGEVPNKSK